MNNEAIKQKTNELAELLRNSDEHRIYLDAKCALTETKARAVCWMNTAYCKPVFRRERLPVRIAARK